MTPWERLDAELARKRSSWTALAKSLGATKQTVGHWKSRGIPAKNMRAAADFVGRSLEWLEFGENSDFDLPPPNKDGIRWPMGPLKDPGVDIYQALEKIAWCISVSPHRGSDAISGALLAMCKEPESQIYLEILERLLSEKKGCAQESSIRDRLSYSRHG